MIKYLEEVPETVVGVKLGCRHELKWLSLPSPLTKNVVFLFLTGPRGQRKALSIKQCDQPYQQAHHARLEFDTTNLGVGSRRWIT